MPSLPNPLKIATKSAETAFQIGTFVAGQAFGRVQRIVGGDDQNDTYAPTTPAQSPQPTRLESVKDEGTTSTGSKPTDAKTTATGPGGTNRMAPKAPAKKPAARKPAASASSAKEITAPPSTSGTKGETSTTVKATSRTGARSAGGRISNPKAAAKARKRNAGASPKTGAGAGTGQATGSATAAARTGDLSKAKGKGGRPATVKAENSPIELAASKSGKQAAPLGADSDS
jgi:hypothetical protein